MHARAAAACCYRAWPERDALLSCPESAHALLCVADTMAQLQHIQMQAACARACYRSLLEHGLVQPTNLLVPCTENLLPAPIAGPGITGYGGIVAGGQHTWSSMNTKGHGHWRSARSALFVQLCSVTYAWPGCWRPSTDTTWWVYPLHAAPQRRQQLLCTALIMQAHH